MAKNARKEGANTTGTSRRSPHRDSHDSHPSDLSVQEGWGLFLCYHRTQALSLIYYQPLATDLWVSRSL
jgi:hypothetical protein